MYHWRREENGEHTHVDFTYWNFLADLLSLKTVFD
ncbi:hypothetical protein AVEN_222923-1, partial [Araneus ventricosus]